MALSTEIPNATLKIIIVDGLIVIPRKPIIPAVMIKGIRLEMSDMIIIRAELNSMAIRAEIRIMARTRLMTRCFIRYFVPSK